MSQLQSFFSFVIGTIVLGLLWEALKATVWILIVFYFYKKVILHG